VNAAFVLVHSPLVGPFTWSRVAGELRGRGEQVVVPVLSDDDRGEPVPYWRQHAECVARALAPMAPARPLVLVGHSGAGPELPAIADVLSRVVAAYLFVDAGLPSAGPRLGGQRRRRRPGERWPRWSDADLSDVLTDPGDRRRVLGELNPRPQSFWDEEVPVFEGWPDAACGYLLFGPPYDTSAREAERRGWPVERLPGGHFHMLVEPEAVATALLELAAA
jgi:thioesterase domain-containing protein